MQGSLEDENQRLRDRIKKLEAELELYKPKPRVRPPKPVNRCLKCGGEGWLWGYELDDPDPDTYDDGMTRYTCDACKGTCEERTCDNCMGTVIEGYGCYSSEADSTLDPAPCGSWKLIDKNDPTVIAYFARRELGDEN